MRSATSSAIRESLPNPDTLVPRSFTTTRALRSARSSTYARPSPRPAPVTTATFPSNEIRSVISLSSCGEPRNRPIGSDPSEWVFEDALRDSGELIGMMGYELKARRRSWLTWYRPTIGAWAAWATPRKREEDRRAYLRGY